MKKLNEIEKIFDDAPKEKCSSLLLSTGLKDMLQFMEFEHYRHFLHLKFAYFEDLCNFALYKVDGSVSNIILPFPKLQSTGLKIMKKSIK